MWRSCLSVLCFILVATQFIFSKGTEIKINKRYITPADGTHLKLETEYHVYLNLPSSPKSKKFVFNVVELFSSSVFLDEFELSNFVRAPISSERLFSNFTIFNSRVSVEEPESVQPSIPILSLFSQEFLVPKDHKKDEPIIVKISTPFHLRYQTPSDKKLYRNVPVLKFPFYSFISSSDMESIPTSEKMKPNVIDLESFLFSVQKKNDKTSDKYKFISRKRIAEEEMEPKIKATKELVHDFFSKMQQNQLVSGSIQNAFLGKSDLEKLNESSNWFLYVKMPLGDLTSITTVIVFTLLVTVFGSLIISFF